ncbi:MAG: hypothetical protein ACJAS4_001163 [Bacteriovoracaceae bacterium]|jgi:hypothetical protein
MKKIIISLLFSTSIIAASNGIAYVDKQDISQYEISKNHKNIKSIVERFEVHEVDGSKLQMYVPRFRGEEFEKLAPNGKLIMSSIYSNSLLTHKGQAAIPKGYKSYDEVIQIMKDLAFKFPDFVALKTYGKSVKGSDLFYLKISDNVQVNEQEPEIMVTAATHGDELITTETLIRIISEMMTKKDTDERIMKMIQDHELFFIPIVNPDGFQRQRRYTSDGTDPNREYPYPDKPNKKSVQCIQKLIEFFNSRDFVASMDLHASGELIMYPWGFTKDEVPSADKNIFSKLGKKMSQENKYKVGQISRIIYVAPASSADYYYWKKGTIAYGIELARSKAPRWGIEKVINSARPMIYTFIESF